MAADGESVKNKFPLHKAVIDGQLDEVRRLIREKRSLIDQQDEAGCTPLHYAALYGNLEIAGHLVSNRANCFIEDQAGRTPLDCAVEEKEGVKETEKLNVLMFLLTSDVNLRRTNGKTLLHHAASHGGKKCIEFLIRRKAQVDIQDSFGNTPLQDAVDAKRPEAIVILIEHGARLELKANQNINVEDRYGKTALDYAVQHKNLKAIAALLTAGAVLEKKDESILSYKDKNRKTVQDYIDEKKSIPDRIRETFKAIPMSFQNHSHVIDSPKVAAGESKRQEAKEREKEKESVQPLFFDEFSKNLNDHLETFNMYFLNEIEIISIINSVTNTVAGILNSLPNSAERDERLLLLCHQTLQIDTGRPKKDYSFFDVAVESLKFGSEKLKGTEEYRYFQNMKALKGEPEREVAHNLYKIMLPFDDVVQEAKFVPEDQEKAYKWANGQMERISNPQHYDEEASEKLSTELSSKGEAGKTTPYLLGRTAGWASIFLGVVVIVAAGISVGATFGLLSVPIFLPTLWLSYTLIGVGLAAIAGGVTAKNVVATPYKNACQAKKEWKGVCANVAAFWHPPESKPSKSGIGMDCLGGICALMGAFLP